MAEKTEKATPKKLRDARKKGKDGWDGPGWYDASDEYGMGLEDGKAYFDEYGGMKY